VGHRARERIEGSGELDHRAVGVRLCRDKRLLIYSAGKSETPAERKSRWRRG